MMDLSHSDNVTSKLEWFQPISILSHAQYGCFVLRYVAGCMIAEFVYVSENIFFARSCWSLPPSPLCIMLYTCSWRINYTIAYSNVSVKIKNKEILSKHIQHLFIFLIRAFWHNKNKIMPTTHSAVMQHFRSDTVILHKLLNMHT